MGENAVTGDIEKAFLMVAVDPKDRKFLRFLWLDKDDQLKVYQFERVPFGTSASPF